MSNERVLYISIILQLVVDGNADLSKLDPNVKALIDGAVGEYLENPDEEENQLLYHYATMTLNVDKEKMN